MGIEYESYKKMSREEFFNALISGFVNKNIEEAFRKLAYCNGKKPFGKDFSIYRLSYCYLACNLKNASDNVDVWIELCNLYHTCTDEDIKKHCGVIALKLISIMLDNGLYIGRYKDKLMQSKAFFKSESDKYKPGCIPKLLCGSDIVYLHYLDNDKFNKSFIKFIVLRLEESFLRDIFIEFISGFYVYFLHNIDARDYFLEHANYLFDGYIDKIKRISDIDYTFFRIVQAKLLKEKNAISLLRVWCKFFVFLLSHSSGDGKNIFKDGDPTSIQTLIYKGYSKLLIEGFEFVFYNPMSDVPQSDRWIIGITDNQSSLINNSVSLCKKIDFLQIENKMYREFVKEYIWRSDLNFDTKKRRLINFIKLLNKLYEIKSVLKTSYDYVSKDEIVLMYQYIEQNESNLKYVLFKELQIILNFAVQKGYIKLEANALVGLQINRKPYENKAKAIPDNHIEKLNDYMLQKSSESLKQFYCYIIFHMLYQSEFRISEICNFKVGCVSYQEKEHNILSISKTSKKEVYERTITDFFKDLIREVENVSADFRQACHHEEYNKYLFLYKNEEGFFVHVIPNLFRNYLNRCCEELGLPKYTITNIRDTHMSKAHEYRLRKNLSDAVMGILTGHRNVDITVNHYIEDNLRDRLLFMTDKIIGDVRVDGVIVDELPNDLQMKKYSVERGCGVCSLKTCADDVFYNCFACKHFYTTVNMLPRFEERREYLEALLTEDEANGDIKAKLELINQWIVAIRKIKEK